MKPIDYEAEYARLRREIDALPPDERESLRALHAESVTRHAQIQDSRAKSREALAALQEHMTALGEGLRSLDTALADLRLQAKLALFELEARRREADASGDEGPAHD